MIWYKHLYIGKKASRRRFAILQGIRNGKVQPEVYVITPPQNGNNVLDIYPSAMLLLPPYRDQEHLLIGVAVTYWEALEVVRRIVDDMYRTTGGFDWRAFVSDSLDSSDSSDDVDFSDFSNFSEDLDFSEADSKESFEDGFSEHNSEQNRLDEDGAEKEN